MHLNISINWSTALSHVNGFALVEIMKHCEIIFRDEGTIFQSNLKLDENIENSLGKQ
jgi:hypothetical protein